MIDRYAGMLETALPQLREPTERMLGHFKPKQSDSEQSKTSLDIEPVQAKRPSNTKPANSGLQKPSEAG